MGFIAQDVAKTCEGLGQNLSLYAANYKNDDELCETEYLGEDVDDERLTWGLSYEQLIAPMVAVIQSQNKRISELEKQIAELRRPQRQK